MTTKYAPAGWAKRHHCNRAVANAIHEIATPSRSPEAIWKEPTEDEWVRVTELVTQAIWAGLHRHADDESYAWDRDNWIRLEPDREE